MRFARLLLDRDGVVTARNALAAELIDEHDHALLPRLAHAATSAAGGAIGDVTSLGRRRIEWRAAAPLSGVIVAIAVDGTGLVAEAPLPHVATSSTIVVHAASLRVLDAGPTSLANLIDGAPLPTALLSLFEPTEQWAVLRALTCVEPEAPTIGPFRLRGALGGRAVHVAVTDRVAAARPLLAMHFELADGAP